MNGHVHPVFARLLNDFAATLGGAPARTIVLQEQCPSCEGVGGNDDGRCMTCHGRRVIEVERSVP